jgi:tryptophan 2,3-dioxygenase
MPTDETPLTYSRYLKVDELLTLQEPRSDGPEHDEMLFIITHQVYELWFKQVLHELAHLQRCLLSDDTSRALHTLRRVLTILKILVAQLDILETMNPMEFLSFRDRLESASGFQSSQFRELEFALGYKRRATLAYYREGSATHLRLTKMFHEPSLWDAFLRYLDKSGHAIPPEALARDVTEPVQAYRDVQKVLIHIYRNDPMIGRVCERLVDLDEGIQEWRYRHVKMVERTIGTKQGTGGSAGVEYLTRTLFKPLFPDLWAIRAEL